MSLDQARKFKVGSAWRVAKGNHSNPRLGYISVVISGSDVFRGFFLQARDARSNEPIGEWLQTENTNTIPECSAITHGDNRDKLQAVLVWKAPNNRQGLVYFT